MKIGKRREARGKKKNMKKRITLWLLATLFLANVSLAEAQQPAKVPRIGFLSSLSPAAVSARMDAFRQGLRELGYVEGKNIVIESRWAQGKTERLPTRLEEH